MYTFAIGIPTINRIDLLERALKQYAKRFCFINCCVIDNGKQNIDKLNVFNLAYPPPRGMYTYNPEVNLGVAMSWNQICFWAFEMNKSIEYAVVLNDDLILQYSQDDFQRYLNEQKPMLATHGSGWCAFIIHRSVFEKVGFFDFNFFPAYFEDADYAYRCKLAGIKIDQPEILRTIEIEHSASIRKDPSLNDRFEINRQYYIQKWGGTPGEEKFTEPFNIKL